MKKHAGKIIVGLILGIFTLGGVWVYHLFKQERES